MTDRLYDRLQRIEKFYLTALRDMVPNPRRYMAISVALTVANVATGVKYGVATKVASLIF